MKRDKRDESRTVRRGDFRVRKDDIRRAEEVFGQRSERSQAADKALRGPITTDVERYADAGGRIFDFPGVDTPTDEPRQGATDLPFPDEHPGRGDDRVRVDPVQRSTREQTRADVRQMSEQGESLLDVVSSLF